LVLSGGGAKGAFTAGAVKHLIVERGLTFDLVVGTSTGSLVAPLVATLDVADLLNIYENVENQDILADRPDLLAFLLSNALNGTEPLERLINRFFGDPTRYRRLVDAPVELFVTVVNLQTGAVEYGSPRQDSKGDFLKKMLASASVPVLMPPVKIGKHQYVDGGVKDVTPFAKAIEEGATHIVAIILSPGPAHRPPQAKEFSSAFAITGRTLELLLDEVVDTDVKIASLYTEGIRDLERIRANARERLGLSDAQVRQLFVGLENPFEGRRIVEITVIRPDRELLGDSLSFDPVAMREMVDLGHATARRVVEEAIARGVEVFGDSPAAMQRSARSRAVRPRPRRRR
jgi:NTE family protein